MTAPPPVMAGRVARSPRIATLDVALALELPGPVPVPAFTVGRGALPTVTEHPLVVIDGAVLQRVAIGRRVAAELLGPGDVLSVARGQDGPCVISTRALIPSAFAVVGHVRSRDGQRSPALDVALVAATFRRAAAALEQRVLLQLPRLDERLSRLLPRLADRWGVVTADGVVLPDFLRHPVMAELTGVRRPSFTTVAARLAERGVLERLPDGRWRVDLDLVVAAG